MNAKLTDRKNRKLEINNNVITGDTFEIKDYLKKYCDAKWDKEAKGWMVDEAKFEKYVNSANSIGLRII